MENKEFPEGMIVKEGNVDFCKAKVSYKVDELKSFFNAYSLPPLLSSMSTFTHPLTELASNHALKNDFKPKPVEESQVNDDLPF